MERKKLPVVFFLSPNQNVMNRLRHILIISVILFISAAPLFAQSLRLKIIDKQSRETCPYAHVSVTNAETQERADYAADPNGQIDIKIPNSATVSVSFVGYKTHQFSIKNTQPNYTISVTENNTQKTIQHNKNKPFTLAIEPDVFGVEQVVVTGQYRPQAIDKSIYKVALIGSRQITQKGATNLADLLTTQSNIQLTQSSALGTSLKIQGLTGENIKIMVDGVPVIGRLNGNIDLSQLNLNNIDHVEIVRGPMSVVYGSNALAGTINIITKENNCNRIVLNSEAYYESVGRYNSFTSISAIKGKHTFDLLGARNFFSGLSFNNTRYKEFKPKEQYNVDAGYLFTNKNLKVKFKSSAFTEDIRHHGNLQTNTAYWPYFAQAIDSRFITNRLNNILKASNQFGKTGFWEAMGSYAYYSRTGDTYIRDMTTLTDLPIDESTTTFTSKIMRATAGSELEKQNMNWQTGIDINIDDAFGERINAENPKMSDYAAFLTTQCNFTENASLQTGLRYIYNSKYKAPLVPSINYKHKLFGLMNIRASYSRGFRAPSIKELYLDFKDINHNIEGNDSLLAESSHSYNLNFALRNDLTPVKFAVDADLFYNDGHNIIDLIPVNDPNSDQLLYVNRNFLKRKTKGGTLGVELRKWTLLVRADITNTGIARTLPIDGKELFSNFAYSTDFAIKTSGNIVKTNTNYSIFYKHTGKAEAPFVTGHAEGSDEIGLYITDAYHTLDVSVNQKVGKNINVVVGAKNLFDNTYVLIRNGEETTEQLTSWGRSFFVKLGYRFNY